MIYSIYIYSVYILYIYHIYTILYYSAVEFYRLWERHFIPCEKRSMKKSIAINRYFYRDACKDENRAIWKREIWNRSSSRWPRTIRISMKVKSEAGIEIKWRTSGKTVRYRNSVSSTRVEQVRYPFNFMIYHEIHLLPCYFDANFLFRFIYDLKFLWIASVTQLVRG